MTQEHYEQVTVPSEEELRRIFEEYYSAPLAKERYTNCYTTQKPLSLNEYNAVKKVLWEEWKAYRKAILADQLHANANTIKL
jgi:hypothetical protein